MESAPRSGAARWTRHAILLNARGTQTGKAVRLEHTLPGEELLLGELVAAQSLLHCDPAAAHGSHHRGFAADDPPFGVGGGRSPIGGAPDHSMTLFTRYREDLGLRRSKTIAHARRFSVGELGCLPLHNSAYSHLLALVHNPVPYRWA